MAIQSDATTSVSPRTEVRGLTLVYVVPVGATRVKLILEKG